MMRLLRWRFVRDLATRAIEKDAPGLWGGMLARKGYADDQVADALDSGIGQVVFLGAGLDTRAFRLVAPAGAEAIELDLPANVAYKTPSPEAASRWVGPRCASGRRSPSI